MDTRDVALTEVELLETCRLCLALQTTHTTAAHDRPLAESSSFVAVPSLGALVAGYVLIVPKRHVLSVGSMAPEEVDEASRLIETVKATGGETYSSTVIFEHGPSQCGSPLGCSVDHAHIHIVPSKMVLHESQVLRDYEWLEVGGLSRTKRAAAEGKPYIFLTDATGTSYMTHSFEHSEPRQLVRRALATDFGIPEEYDWREFPHLENVETTLTLFEVHCRQREELGGSGKRSTRLRA